ncbi:MAG: cupredoxin family copper-binding protein [Candidatus Paceibacterota bacterium]
MKGYIYLIIILLIILAGGLFIYYNKAYNPAMTMNNQPQTQNNNPPGETNPGNNTPQNNPPTSTTKSINIQGFAFNPKISNVSVGTTVVWTNNDSAPHTITSSDNAFASSNAINPGQSYSYTFTTSGTYNYHCNIHPSMTGQIVVQ